MLELLVLAPEDGWAFVRAEGATWLLRPPYSRSNLLLVDKSAVVSASTKFGFAPPAGDTSFDDWSSLIEFLNQQIIQSRASAGRPLPELGAPKELLDAAPPEVLRDFLGRVENELLPKHQWEHATNLLTAMLMVPGVRANGQICERLSSLLEKAQEARVAAEAFRWQLAREASFDIVFPSIARHFGRDRVIGLAQQVARSGHVFALR